MFYNTLKYFVLLAALVSFFITPGCSGSAEDKHGEDITVVDAKAENVFAGKVYMCAPGLDEDSVSVYGECDCCSDQIIFKGDSDLVFISYCMSDQSVINAKYHIEGEELVLKFGTKCVEQKYNEEREVDSTAVEYLISEKVCPSNEARYKISRCKNKTLITWKSTEPQYGMETDITVEEALSALKQVGILDRLDKTN